jgi:sugar lactone lactonase YvrE
VSILAESPQLLGVDGLAFDVHGNVWAAVIAQSTIVRVSPTGAITTVATAADGLDWASSIAFGKNGDLWAVNYAIGPPGGPGPALLRIAVGVKGQPVP